ncbi:head GIN domain-containing protein [Flavobacterium okayamense]|uniref:Putative auto-transporter adhesin head GIN domain-containing protein n=1 Tax=Flavobacterium okayamense TaxID=2830782 RepID=A0ABN6HU65_9FLAO|nr:head GIN domain-containing protein [Flavobacterium okayamense]BCY27826.1 hypothetical protein KK2020170_06940 [Flavobacterium okayamense]
MKNYFYILLLVLLTSCGISEDCLKGNGSPTTLIFPVDNFTKVKVYSGVGLVVKEGPLYEVKVETRDNIKDNIEVTLNGDMLVVKDNSTCNIARDYGVTTVYVTAPNIQEIHSKTEQEIKSDGILNFPELKLYSIGDDGDGAGTGDFYINLDCNFLYIESNTFANYYLNGETNDMNVFFSWGDGRFYGENLSVNNVLSLTHRGSNDMILYPLKNIEGVIYSSGNVILKNEPIGTINVQELYSGRLILDY